MYITLPLCTRALKTYPTFPLIPPRRAARMSSDPTNAERQRAALAADDLCTAGPVLGARGGGDAILRRTGYRTGPWAKYHKRVFFGGCFRENSGF